ncbi:MAG: riboflavin synthase [Alphaproteobacteria bacterium]|nr:riboflavin synthase [Alphaproteobacteria bacterium]
MFTGIVTDLGRVKRIVAGGDRRLEIATAYDTAGIATGASIACSGACLTVVDKGSGWFGVQVSAETLARTTLGSWKEGRPVNLERPSKVGDELGGHLVLGHVDGIARVAATAPEGDSLRIELDAPEELGRFIAAKGSVTLDGVSLTVNTVRERRFAINIIPHTRTVTTLGTLRTGDAVNLEIDVVARYVARLLGKE